jgi:hypothetical protein
VGESSKTVTVTIKNDTVPEPDETFGLIVQQNSSDPVTTYLAKATFTIVDNDTGTPPASFTLSGSAQCNGSLPQIVLSGWGSSGATTFDVYRNGSLYSPANTGSTFTNTSVTAGTTYSYYVVAKNASGLTTSNTISVTARTNCGGTTTAPTAPSGLVALAASSFMSLAWNDNSSDETGFKVERKIGVSGSWSQIASTGQGIAAYLDYGVSAGVTYYYRVSAYNSSGSSAYSNEASVTIGGTAPTSFTLTATPQCSGSSPQIVLSGWGSSGFTTFDLYRNGSLFYPANTDPTFTNTSVTAGTTYSYYVVAKNASGSTTSNNTVSVTAPTTCGGALLSAPTLSSPTNSATSVSITPTFSWSSVSGATSYWLMVATSSSSLPTSTSASGCSGCVISGSIYSTSYTPPTSFYNNGATTTLSPGTTYYWQVMAFNSTTSGYYSTQGSFTTAPAIATKVVTVANTGGIGLNLRSTASTSGAVIAALPEGTTMSVIGGPTLADGFTWWNISGISGTGWSAVAEWLSPSPRVGILATVSYTGGAGLRVRNGASLTGTVLTTLTEGTQVIVFGGPIQADGFTWWAVRDPVDIDGFAGWSAVGDWLTPNPRY